MHHLKVLITALALAVAAGCGPSPPKETAGTSTAPTLAEFYLYSCVGEYQKLHALPLFDSSQGYAVEHLNASAETLARVHAQASTFARTLRAPDLSDEEHGGVAVLALCLRQSQGAEVSKLAAASPGE